MTALATVGIIVSLALALLSIGLSLWSMALQRKAQWWRDEADRIMRQSRRPGPE